MIVVCKNCNTKYDIKEDVIPDQGAQLKCAKCENMIFVTRDNVKTDISSEPENNESLSAPFSDFDERPTILAPESFHENLNKELNDTALDAESSSKSGISPSFLSDKHKSGPSFDEVFDDFEEEISNDDKKKTSLNTQDENSKKLENIDKPVKKDSIDDDLDNLFNDLTSDSKSKHEKEVLDEKVKDTSSLKLDDEPTLDIEEMERKQEEEKRLKKEEINKENLFKQDTSSNTKVPKINNDDGETQEISNLQMEELKEKLKDGLNDSDFIGTENSSNVKNENNENSKIFVKLENGPSIEFQIEKDLIQWLKAKSSLKGVLYSLDDIEFSPILNHQLFKDVEEIIKKAKDEEVDVVSASDILEKRELPKKANLMPIVMILGVLIVLLVVYILHLSNVVNISFLDAITPKPKIIKINHTEIEEATTRVKIKKIKKEEVKKEEVKKEVKKEEVKKEEVKKEVKKEEVKKEEVKKEEVKKEEAKKEEAKKEVKKEIHKISSKEKRGYYKKARLAVKAKKVKIAKEMYLTLAYNFPKEAEAYGVLFGILKKDKDTKKYASKFIRAYKALVAKKENTFVNKKLIKELLK